MPDNDRFSLEGKIALVTGAGRGIGKAIAEGFVGAGAKVWLTDILKEEGESTAATLGMPFVQADLSQLGDIDRIIELVSAEEKRLDVLVNNAGLDRLASIGKFAPEDLDIVWYVNCRAPVLLVQGFLPLLRASQGASIINITSVHEAIPHPQNLSYNMSKAALAMFTKSMAQELSPEGIRINNIGPGAVETNINREILADIGHENFNKWIPIGRVAQTSEMVGPAIFLASDAASYVTGATLFADGGYLQNLVRYRLDV
ncbi:MAG: SDR family oxidoreductase [Chloroflexi bacterium]|nr:SDR family oxidoreductase [Chloroflexota bacterium]